MTISWYGEACFLLENGGTRILVEPPQKESGINPPRLKSDILIYSKKRKEDDQTGAFIIDGPGEYEVKGINISGISDGDNIIYNIDFDGVKIAHLGFIKKIPDDEILSMIDDPDIVLVPTGGGELLDPETAMKLINQLEPSIAVPMLYDIKGLKTKRLALTPFIKESGTKESPQTKLTVKKKDLVEEETKIIILEHV